VGRITSRLAAGAPFTGKIARHAEFGLFVELEPGIDGLVHVSQLPPGVTLKDAPVAVGESVTGWVKEIDPAQPPDLPHAPRGGDVRPWTGSKRSSPREP